MSDLRQQLEAAVLPVVAKMLGEDCTEFEAYAWADLIGSTCEPFVAAARQETAQRCAEAILAARPTPAPVFERCDPEGGYEGDNEDDYRDKAGTYGCEPWTACEGNHYNGTSISLLSAETYAEIAREVGAALARETGEQRNG